MWPNSGWRYRSPRVSSPNQVDRGEVLTTTSPVPRLVQTFPAEPTERMPGPVSDLVETRNQNIPPQTLTGRTSSQQRGPLFSSQSRESHSSTAARHPFLSSLLQNEPLLPIPIERERPRIIQRNFRQYPCYLCALEESDLSLPGSLINNNPSLLFLSDTRGHIHRMCSLNNDPHHACTNDVPHLEMGDDVHNRRLPSTSSSSLNFTSAATSLDFDCPSRLSYSSNIIDTWSCLPGTSGTSHLDSHNNNCNKPIDEMTNHDRSTDEVSSPSPTPESDLMSATLPYKLSTLSMPIMPPPSANARQVAARVIKHTRTSKIPEESLLLCPDCKLFPTLPVTGQCGHTRCTKCIKKKGACPCGVPAPGTLLVNTLIQDLIRKISPKHSYTSVNTVENENSKTDRTCFPASKLIVVRPGGGIRRRVGRSSRFAPLPARAPSNLPSHMPMASQVRFQHARGLLAAGRYREAAPHLARVAASVEPFAHSARILLAQAITILSRGRDPRRLTRELYRSVRLQGANSWLQPTDLECVLCYHTYTNPVTTPCGHTYCRTCIERCMDYKKTCALCLRPLDDFNLAMTSETEFISAALASIDALSSPSPPDPDVIPIFVCTVAYPTIPCPLFIFDPRYWLMIRRVLESGSRKFGMVTYERDRNYSDYGTVLEVCDCVHLEDGRSILSTVGVSRFKVMERDVRDGCDVARIQPLIDITPTEELVIWELRLMATQISYKALLWLNSMNRTVRSEIEAAFGQFPHLDPVEEDWFESPEGPAWLWWLIAILPLRTEIKVLILSTTSLLKRMMAVSRTLEAIDQVAMASTVTSDCELTNALSNAEEWLEG